MINFIKKYLRDEDATAFVEAALLIPVLTTLLMGVFDLGSGIVINQKTISASQVAADLVARVKTIDQAMVDDIVVASKLAFDPYDTSSFGIDIISVEFDDEGYPVQLWRDTRNMPQNNNALDSTIGLGEEGEGMIIVSTRFTYLPYFTHLFTNEFNMEEVAFTRGRRSKTVRWDD